MKFRRTPVLALVAALAVGLVAAPPATSTPTSQTAATEQGTATAKKSTKKGTISGTVKFQGKPVADTWVTAYGGGKEFTAHTDAKGRFNVKAPAGSYRVLSDDWRGLPVMYTWFGNTLRKPDAKKVKVRAGKKTKISLKLKAGAHVTGRIFESDGTPADEARYYVSSARYPGLPESFETDEDGYYQLRYLRSDTLKIWPALGPRTEPPTRAITVRVKKGKIVTAPDLHQTEAETGTITARIEGAEEFHSVYAYPEDTFWSERLELDPETGIWSAEVPAGKWSVRVNGAQTESDVMELSAGATVDAGTLVVPAERGAIHVTALDTKGEPLEYGHVHFEDMHQYTVKRKDPIRKKVVKSGKLVPGTYWVTLNQHYPRSPRPQKVVVEAGVTKHVTLQLEKGRTVRGVVSYQGKPVRGMVVFAEAPGMPWSPSGSAKTDAKGRFVMKNVPRGARHLRVRDPWPVYRDATATFKKKGKVKGLKIELTK